MKKLTSVLVCIIMLFSFCACSKEKPKDESIPEKPPAFSVLHKKTKLEKHARKGENAVFSESDFKDLIGESPEYITVTSLPDAQSGSLLFNGAPVIKGQNLPASRLEFLKFVPNGDVADASFMFSCKSESYSGEELVCEITFTDEVNSPPVATNSKMKAVSGIMCFCDLDIIEPNGDDFTINVITYPSNGYVTVNPEGRVLYTPEEGFSGKDRLVYSVRDCFGNVSESATLEINVEKNENQLVFQDMKENLNHFYAYNMCEDDVMVYRLENGKYYFDPDTPVSKVEFLVMLMCVSGLDSDIVAVADSIISDDEGLSSGLKGYISAAAQKELIMLENGKFKPDEEITFSDAAFMIAAALKLPFRTSSDGESLDASLNSVVSAGIFDKDCQGDEVISKSESAKILYRIQEYKIENNMK